MHDLPLILGFCLVILQLGGEMMAMQLTGTLRKRHRREWTYHAVTLPYKAMMVAVFIEHVWFHARGSAALMWTGGLLALAGVAIRLVCHFQLAGAFSQYVEKSEGQRLIQSGLYAVIRHPMYTGTLLSFVGMPLMLAARWAWVATVLGFVGIALRIRKEEAFLVRELPGYREYMERTWRLVPRIC